MRFETMRQKPFGPVPPRDPPPRHLLQSAARVEWLHAFKITQGGKRLGVSEIMKLMAEPIAVRAAFVRALAQDRGQHGDSSVLQNSVGVPKVLSFG